MKLTITVFYSCPLCATVKAAVTVPARESEDVGEWMENTVRLLGDDHRARSPHCHPAELKNVMIPMSGRDRIGGPVMQ